MPPGAVKTKKDLEFWTKAKDIALGKSGHHLMDPTTKRARKTITQADDWDFTMDRYMKLKRGEIKSRNPIRTRKKRKKEGTIMKKFDAIFESVARGADPKKALSENKPSPGTIGDKAASQASGSLMVNTKMGGQYPAEVGDCVFIEDAEAQFPRLGVLAGVSGDTGTVWTLMDEKLTTASIPGSGLSYADQTQLYSGEYKREYFTLQQALSAVLSENSSKKFKRAIQAKGAQINENLAAYMDMDPIGPDNPNPQIEEPAVEEMDGAVLDNYYYNDQEEDDMLYPDSDYMEEYGLDPESPEDVEYYEAYLKPKRGRSVRERNPRNRRRRTNEVDMGTDPGDTGQIPNPSFEDPDQQDDSTRTEQDPAYASAMTQGNPTADVGTFDESEYPLAKRLITRVIRANEEEAPVGDEEVDPYNGTPRAGEVGDELTDPTATPGREAPVGDETSDPYENQGDKGNPSEPYGDSRMDTASEARGSKRKTEQDDDEEEPEDGEDDMEERIARHLMKAIHEQDDEEEPEDDEEPEDEEEPEDGEDMEEQEDGEDDEEEPEDDEEGEDMTEAGLDNFGGKKAKPFKKGGGRADTDEQDDEEDDKKDESRRRVRESEATDTLDIIIRQIDDALEWTEEEGSLALKSVDELYVYLSDLEDELPGDSKSPAFKAYLNLKKLAYAADDENYAKRTSALKKLKSAAKAAKSEMRESVNPR